MRYIQIAVSNEDHREFSMFARRNELTLGELVETAIKAYIISQTIKADKALDGPTHSSRET